MYQEIKIYTAQDGIQTAMVLAALKSEGIPAYKKELGAGGITSLYFGSSVFGADIFVSPADAQSARTILMGMGLLEPPTA